MNDRMKQLFTLLLLIVMTPWCQAQIITTVAGGGTAGIGDGGPAADCELNNPIGIAVDAAGNIYIGDRDNNRIRKINTAGIITTIAGTGAAGFSGDGGPATDAKIYGPYGLCVDNSGNVYFADNGNDRVRQINNSGIISTIAGGGSGGLGDGGLATDALLSPGGVVKDLDGNFYIADGINNRVRKIDALGIITTIAGGGSDVGSGIPATNAKLNTLYSIAIDNDGNIYTGEQSHSRVLKITPSGLLTIIAGTGSSGYNGDNIPATSAKLHRVNGLAVDNRGNVYISDGRNNRIRMVNSEGIITTIAGTGIAGYSGDGGPATSGQFSTTTGIAIGLSNNLFVADFANDRVREISNVVNVANNPIAKSNDFTLYPNPNNGKFTIGCSSKLVEPYDVVVTDMLGMEVYKAEGVRGQSIDINLKVPSGMYVVQLQGESNSMKQRMMVQH